MKAIALLVILAMFALIAQTGNSTALAIAMILVFFIWYIRR